MAPGTIDELIIKIDSDINGALSGIRKVDRAVDKMDAGVGKAATSIRNATGKIVKSFALVGAAAAVGLAVAVGKATMTFADFEQAVTNAASVTGQSGAQYEATKKNIEELSKTLGETTVFSAQQAASAMYDLASAGYDVGTMVESDLVPIMDLAAATQTDLTFATETVTSTLGQFGLGIESSSNVADIFAKTIGSSKASLDKLALSMRQVGPVAHSLGMDIEDVNAMLGVLFNAGFKGEQAGTALKSGMARLMVPTSAVNNVLKSIGLTFDQVNPATHDFADTLELLQKQGLDTNAAMELFGQEAAPAMMALMANTSGVRELEAALRDSGGAAADMATKQLNTLQGALTLLKSATEGLMISVGGMAAPAVRDFAMKLKDAIPHIKTLVEQGFVKLKQIISDLTPTWNNLSSIMNSAKGILSDIFIAISGGSGDTTTFTNAINSLTGALSAVFKWIDEHPTVTKLIATIGLAAVAFAYIVPIVTAVVGAVGSLITFVSALAAAIGGATSVIGAITAVIAVLGGPITVIIGLVALLAAAWATNFFGIRDITKKVIDFIKDIFLRMVNFLGPLVANWLNSYIKIFNLLIPFLNKAGLDINKIAEVQFTRLEKTVADTADSIEGSAQDISGAMKQVETDMEQSATGAAKAYEEFGNITASTSEKLTMGMVEAGISRKDLAKRAEDIASGVITPAGMVKSIIGPLGTEPAVKIVDEQKETNQKLDKLDNLNKLSEISTKLDKLKIEVNNYVTNNTSGGSVSRSTGGSSLVDSTKTTQGVSTDLAKKLADPLGYSNRYF